MRFQIIAVCCPMCGHLGDNRRQYVLVADNTDTGIFDRSHGRHLDLGSKVNNNWLHWPELNNYWENCLFLRRSHQFCDRICQSVNALLCEDLWFIEVSFIQVWTLDSFFVRMKRHKISSSKLQAPVLWLWQCIVPGQDQDQDHHHWSPLSCLIHWTQWHNTFCTSCDTKPQCYNQFIEAY